MLSSIVSRLNRAVAVKFTKNVFLCFYQVNPTSCFYQCTFSQAAVTNIYFGSYFQCLRTKNSN